jgi:intracellular septation protein
MKNLLKPATLLLLDLLSSLVFAIAFALTGNLYVSAGAGIALGLGQIIWMRAHRRKTDALQWMSLGLVIIFGGATLVTQNPLFIKVKPAVIYLVVGAFMCVPDWMDRYMPDIVMENAPDVPHVFGFLWAGLMFTTALVTIGVALRYDDRIYASYLASVPLASKLLLFGLQYLATRVVVRRRILAKRAAGVTG